MQIINWSVNAGDYTIPSKYFKPSITPEKIVREVVSKAQNGDIILMHNGGGPTAEALPSIIMELRKKGLQLVTISQLLGKKQSDFMDLAPLN